MFIVKYSIDGLIREMTINANDEANVQAIITNMFSGGNVEIIEIRRI